MKKKNRDKNQNYLFPCIPTLKTKRKAWLLQLLERSTSSGIPDSFCYDNRHLHSKHHFLFRNASLAETLPSPFSRAVKSPTQIVFNRFLGILGFSYLNPGILDFNGKFGRDSGLKVSRKVVCPPPPQKKHRDYGIEYPYWEPPTQSINVAFIHVCTLVKPGSPIILFQNLNIIQLLISCCCFFL